MKRGNLQESWVVFLISPLKKEIYAIFLPKPADSNGLIVVKLKQDLKYRGYAHFEPVRPNVIYEALNFYEDISISEGLPRKAIINFSETDEHQDVAESIRKKIFQLKQNMAQMRIH